MRVYAPMASFHLTKNSVTGKGVIVVLERIDQRLAFFLSAGYRTYGLNLYAFVRNNSMFVPRSSRRIMPRSGFSKFFLVALFRRVKEGASPLGELGTRRCAFAGIEQEIRRPIEGPEGTLSVYLAHNFVVAETAVIHRVLEFTLIFIVIKLTSIFIMDISWNFMSPYIVFY